MCITTIVSCLARSAKLSTRYTKMTMISPTGVSEATEHMKTTIVSRKNCHYKRFHFKKRPPSPPCPTKDNIKLPTTGQQSNQGILIVHLKKIKEKENTPTKSSREKEKEKEKTKSLSSRGLKVDLLPHTIAALALLSWYSARSQAIFPTP